MIQHTTYEWVRPLLRPGDIVAMGGKGNFSSIIKFFTRSPVSHVAIVMEQRVSLNGEAQDGKTVWLLESTTLYHNRETGKQERGVYERRMSTRVHEYDGDMWVLMLSDEARAGIDWKKYMDICFREQGRGYNMGGALAAGLPFPLPTWRDSMFCSQLAVHALKESGCLPLRNVLPQAVNPQELCETKLFQPTYYQIKGAPRSVPRFNSRAAVVSNF